MRRALARLLRRAADVTDRPLQQPIEAPHEHPESDQQHQDTAQHLAQRVIGEFQIPQAVIDEYRADERQKSRLQWWQFWVALATLVVVAIYTGLAYKQWRQMIRQSNSIEEQVRLSRKALDANERAHLFSKVEQFYIAQPEHLPAIRFVLHNFGKSPAYLVRYAIACRFEPGRPTIAQPYLIDLTIPPGQDAKDLKAKCWNMPKGDTDVMGAGSRPFYVWLLVLYRDPFKPDSDRLAFECWHKPIGLKSSFGFCEPGSNTYSQ